MPDPATGVEAEKIVTSSTDLLPDVDDAQILLVDVGRATLVRASAPLAPVGVVTARGVVILPPDCGLSVRAARSTTIHRLLLASTFVERLATGPCGSLLADLALEVGDGSEAGVRGDACHLPLSSVQSREIGDAWSRLAEELGREGPRNGILVELLVGETLARIHRCRGESAPRLARPVRSGPRGVRVVIDLVDSRYAEEFSLDDLAARSGMSPTSLSRAFRRAAGMPLFEYINRTRIRKACLLLKSTDKPILEIAYAVGYNNISFFNRYFRKVMRLSPRQYRTYSRL